MARGKKLKAPDVVIRQTKTPTQSRDEMWRQVGPLLADMIAQAINNTQHQQR